MWISRWVMVAAVTSSLTAGAGIAGSPFQNGWQLNPANSVLSFQSIKNDTKVELSSFLDYQGGISETGQATVEIDLDSIETGIDLRNVRMRFLFFETFDHPKGRVSLTIPSDMVADLTESRRKRLVLPYVLELAGQQRAMEAEMIVTLIDYNTVSVASAYPISIPVADFGLLNGLRKLEEAAEVEIVPSATASFNFVFARNTPLAAPDIATLSAVTAKAPARSAARLTVAECRTRFEALTLSGRITFESGSAVLAAQSRQLLDTLSGIVSRCPDLRLEVAGHTDSSGDPALNRALSLQRAQSVARALAQRGVDGARLTVVGHGASRPVAENDTARGRERNRRIEFNILDLS